MIDNKSLNILNFIHEMLHFSLKAINHPGVRIFFSQTALNFFDCTAPKCCSYGLRCSEGKKFVSAFHHQRHHCKIPSSCPKKIALSKTFAISAPHQIYRQNLFVQKHKFWRPEFQAARHGKLVFKSKLLTFWFQELHS